MFDIGWTELLVIGVVALIVVGPRDLPGMFRTLGRFTAKARSMARDLSRAMEDAADEAGVKDMAKDLKNMTSARTLGLDKIQDAATKFEKWDPIKSGSGAKKGPATAALAEKRGETTLEIQRSAATKAATSAKTAKPTKPIAKKPARKPKKAAPNVAKKSATKSISKTTKKPATRKSAVKKTSKKAAE